MMDTDYTVYNPRNEKKSTIFCDRDGTIFTIEIWHV